MPTLSKARTKFGRPWLLALVLFLLGSLKPGFTARSADQPFAVEAPSPLRFTVKEAGEPLRAAHAIVLRNPKKTAADWSASSSQPWLKFAPASGSIPARGEVPIDLTIDPEGFLPGIYQVAAEIGTPSGAPQSLAVTMVEEPGFQGVAIGNAERIFPPDSGMANVKTEFGAKGDGRSDDTAAIQQAIASTVHHPNTGARIVYFPVGVYLVSGPLLEKNLKGEWDSLMTLQGENRATTVIKLSDNNPQYQNPRAPTDVVTFASQHAGRFGGGNQAFDNNIFDMTIDVGRGNPGAVALNFMGNNYCALRNVVLQSSDPGRAGAIGLNMQRYAAGPCLMKNVVINGFDYGMKIANNEYSLTFEDLYLLNQKMFGIYNANNVLEIRHLVSKDRVPAIVNKDDAGLITLTDSILLGGSGESSAIQNEGTLYLRNVTSSGYASVLTGTPGSTVKEYASGQVQSQFGSQELSLNLPVEETPCFEETNLRNWKSVVALGADPTGRADSGAAIQAAIDSGATTVYFPTGVYETSRPIVLRGRVRLLEGFDASLNPRGQIFQDPSNPGPLLKVDSGTSEVIIDHMRLGAFYRAPAPGVIGLLQNSSRPVVLRDSIIGGPPSVVSYQNSSQGTGTLFVENVTAMDWKILFPQKVFARQINPEGNMTKIVNRGGDLWILGLKTEGPSTNVDTEQGGATELIGGLIYPVRRVAPDIAGFVVKDSRASLVYAVSAYNPGAENRNFAVQVQETQHGTTKALASTALPSRGRGGTVVPLYRSADGAAYLSTPETKKASGPPGLQ
jgi:hypothetical protein